MSALFLNIDRGRQPKGMHTGISKQTKRGRRRATIPIEDLQDADYAQLFTTRKHRLVITRSKTELPIKVLFSKHPFIPIQLDRNENGQNWVAISGSREDLPLGVLFAHQIRLSRTVEPIEDTPGTITTFFTV